MAFYTVLAPQDSEPSGDDEPVFVKDGFNWPALFIPLIWTVYRRLWLVLLLMLAAILALLSIGGALGLSVYLLGRLWFALEANRLRSWTLERNGHRMIDVIEGRGLEQAERRFFADATATGLDMTGRSTSSADPATATGYTRPAPADTGIVGLFPSPHPTR
ncbi:MAG: DUF2628 domain-containing protein [Hyphomicrobiales bacterium]|nr:DUF2628 domain-containing protein [Hyphomicrobiales bacterium]